MLKFTDLTLPEPLQRAAADLNFVKPTSVQELTIPWLLDNDKDLITIAQTGTGKTAAFGFPVLSLTDIEKKAVQTLILCPTRELCLQIAGDFEVYAKYMPRIKTVAIYGGAPIYKQKELLKSGAHIVVGTPGRVFDMIRQEVLKVDHIACLVLDEADEMLNMGFKEDLFSIMSHTPKEKQTLLFSATMPKEVAKLAQTFMKDPHRITTGNEKQGAENISHFFYRVSARDKYLALKRIADMSPKIYGIIFCRTRNETQEIADKLQQDGYNADALHGDLSQGQRELVMSRFRSKYVRLLVATDVAARGLDVDDLTHIINFHAPLEPDIYIHRSGRTGRAGKSGISITIVHAKEIAALKAIENRLGREITFAKVPTGRDICEKQLFNFIDTVERVEIDSVQIESFLPSVYKKLGWMTREELIQRFVSVEFNRFLNYYKDNFDLDQPEEKRTRESKQSFTFKTFRLSIGANQQLNKRELMRYINKLKVARSIEIGQIDIYKDYCLVDLDARYEEQLLKAIPRNKVLGIPILVEVENPTKRNKGRQIRG
ncbi:MAG: DEAD/DEAH box helicase [Candidatus Cloacimonetes bacterium]|nr:DEAD/DEAH box helicase [Candidatus Cloacimonadota bacterium]